MLQVLIITIGVQHLNALKLNGVDAPDFVTQQAGLITSFNELVNIENNNGLKIGDSLGLHIM